MTDIVYNKNGVPFDIDAIATDLNGKMDVDTVNASDTGKSNMAGYGMPSDTYEDLTFTANTTYTAPSNGYFVLCRTAGAANQYLNMYNNAPGNASNAVRVATGFNAPSTGQYRFWLPARKGDKVYIGTNFSGSNANYDYFGFIYAEGSESEAN